MNSEYLLTVKRPSSQVTLNGSPVVQIVELSRERGLSEDTDLVAGAENGLRCEQKILARVWRMDHGRIIERSH